MGSPIYVSLMEPSLSTPCCWDRAVSTTVASKSATVSTGSAIDGAGVPFLVNPVASLPAATAVADTMVNACGPSRARRVAPSSVLPEQRTRTPPVAHVHATSSACAHQQQHTHTPEAHLLQRTLTYCSTHAGPRTHSSARRLCCPSPPPPPPPSSHQFLPICFYSMASAVATVAAASSTAITCQASSSSRNVSVRSGFLGATLRVSPAARAVRAEKFSVRASSSEELGGTQKQILEAFSGVKAKWDTVENKPTVLLYTGGAVLALWITSAVMGAIDSLPLVPDFLKLVGTIYGGWFVYRYLLFEASRKELATLINDLKNQIADSK
ncbi:unnamed protein product [Closterium sp. NIES-64]|nr:unnamed protein product [Closterium sp. NIES-64]